MVMARMAKRRKSVEEFSSDLLIIVTTHNRKAVTEIALKNLESTKKRAGLWIIDDCSTEYDLAFLRTCAPTADLVERTPKQLGVDKVRYFKQIAALQGPYRYVYHTDNDAFHDPQWIDRIYELNAVFPGNPISLFNSKFHIKDTIATLSPYQAVFRKFSPGISFFLDQFCLTDALNQLIECLKSPNPVRSWDYILGDLIGAPTIVSTVSYLEHFGLGGLHNADYERDRALDPTPFLVKMRSSILEELMTKEEGEKETVSSR